MPKGIYAYSHRACLTARFSNQISITSQAGVGRSTIVANLQKILSGQPYTWVESEDLSEEELKKLANCNWVVAEGRFPHIWLPFAFRVLLICDLSIRARRKQPEFSDLSLEEVREELFLRDRREEENANLVYPGCIWDNQDFDSRINTGQCTAEMAAGYVLDEHRRHLAKIPSAKVIYEQMVSE